MMKEVLRDSVALDWQQTALIFFVALFVVITIYVFFRKDGQELEKLRFLPLNDDQPSSDEGSKQRV